MSIRMRIGLIVPATNSTAEPDFAMVTPKNVSIHSQRMWNVNELTVQVMEDMNSDAEQAARYLAQAKVDFIVYACTTGSFFKGRGYDDQLIDVHRKGRWCARGGHGALGRRCPSVLGRQADIRSFALRRMAERKAPHLLRSSGVRGAQRGGGP